MPYTDDQRKLVREVFVSFSDYKKSLVISQKKIREVLSTLGIAVTDDEVFELCTKMRIHKNASITFKRFIETLDQMIDTVSAIDEFDAAFSSFDRNGDGFITTADLRQVFNDMGMSFPESDLERLLAAVDSKEADRRVNKEQFTHFMQAVISGKQQQQQEQEEEGTPTGASKAAPGGTSSSSSKSLSSEEAAAKDKKSEN